MSTQPLTSYRLEFDEAIDVIEAYYERGWTDGLPIVPPTVGRVRQFVEYVGRSPSEIVGAEPTKGRVITLEKVAINAVMAGCLPEHFPVVLAAIEAISEPKFNLHAMTVSTMGAAVLVVVNGPIARSIGMNSGVSVFGPGHRANAAIGRAIRLVIINVTGSVSGVLDKATLGHAGKYTWCIAEAEDVSPWAPLHVDRGLADGDSAVSVFAGLSPTQVSNSLGNDPSTILNSFGDALFAAGPAQGELVVVLCPEHVGYLRQYGWSKQQVKEFLFERSQRKVSEWVTAGGMEGSAEGADLVGVGRSPESFTLVVAGGPAGAFSSIIPLWGGGSNSQSVTRRIEV